MTCAVMQFPSASRMTPGQRKGAAAGAESKRRNAQARLLERLKTGVPLHHDRSRINAYAKIEGVTAEEWCGSRGVPMVPHHNYERGASIPGEGRRALMLERTTREASVMLGEDRWIVVALLMAGGHLAASDFA